jgi:sulfide:quinone oxidoreductase
MAHVVILGAGIGGLPAAYDLRKALDASHRITVVNRGESFHFVPSNPWVAVGWRNRSDIEFPAAGFLRNKGIEYVGAGAKRVHPKENRIELENGESLAYDYLVIATGPKLAFDEVPGLGPEGHTQSVCHVDHAVFASGAWEKFVRDPGPIVIGAVQGASCYGPAYEFAFIVDTDLRKRKIRDRVPMTFVTAEPYVGHLGLGGVGDSKGLLESEMREHHIKWICNAKTEKVEPGMLHALELGDDGQEKKRHQLPFKFAMMLPAFKGVDAVFGVEGLVNPRGFVLIDAFQRNPTYKNVYSVGVCVAIPPVEATPVPTGAPKTGFMIESMVSATVQNIKEQLAGKEPSHRATWNALCLADFGDSGIAFAALPQIPPRNMNWSSTGKWVHLAKVAYEKYFIRKMKTGKSEPFYEKFVLDRFGIKRLKEKQPQKA